MELLGCFWLLGGGRYLDGLGRFNARVALNCNVIDHSLCSKLSELEAIADSICRGHRSAALLDKCFGRPEEVCEKLSRFRNIQIVAVGTSIFIVNALRLRSLWPFVLQSIVFIDISSDLKYPVRCLEESSLKIKISDWVVEHILGNRSCLVKIDDEWNENLVAIAGALLEYPVVYHCTSNFSNSLSRVPLYVLKTPLFSFSVPLSIWQTSPLVKLAFKHVAIQFPSATYSEVIMDRVAV